MSLHDPSDEGMMNATGIPASETEIETRIRALQHIHQRLMFSDLAEVFPDCTWQTLFSALSRLSKQKHIELVAHRWDYEVIFLRATSSEHGPSGSSSPSERCDHDERAQV
jgi:hypothetical protein